jgi:hypothetical protein
MPLTSFIDEFYLRYIKDSPMVLYKDKPFWPYEVHYDGEEDRYIVVGKWLTSKGTKITAHVDLSEDSLKLGFPQPGWLNVDGRTCVYFYINPAKQYRFALTPAMSIFFNPLEDEYTADLNISNITPALVWSSQAKGKRVANTLWNRKYFSIKKAHDLLTKQKTYLAAAFSKDFALVAKAFRKYPTLYYKTQPIGYTTSHTTVLIPRDNGFMKEMLFEYFLNVEEV